MLPPQPPIHENWPPNLFTEAGWAWLHANLPNSTIHGGKADLDVVVSTCGHVNPNYNYNQGTLGDIYGSLLNLLAFYANGCSNVAAAKNTITAIEAIMDLDSNNG